MKHVTSKLCLIAALSVSCAAFAADPPASASPPGSAKKDCTGLSAAALTQCQQVAGQMDQSARGVNTHSEDSRANGKADPLNPSEPMHSSPVMRTPDEKVAADAVKKGKDPKVAVDKLHAKEGEKGPN